MNRSLFVMALIGGALAAGCTEELPVEVETEVQEVVGIDWPEAAVVYDAAGKFSSESYERAVGAYRGTSICRRDEHRQFDFWLGQYSAMDQDGSDAGENAIETALGGCLITEDYIGTDGIRGRSLNAYDRATEQWIQTFVSELSTNYRLAGGLIGDEMVMTGDRLFVLPSGNLFPVIDRVAWSELGGGEVLQSIGLSIDGGASFIPTGGITYTPADPFEPVAAVGTDACSDAAFAALDGWAGEWTVRLGWFRIGVSTVKVDLSGCVVEEHFRSWRGSSSRSFFSYDNTTESWHRTYVDDGGRAFRLEGSAVEAAGVSGMVRLTGTRPGYDGDVVLHNTVAVTSPDLVEQTWAIDAGLESTYQPTLTLSYHRR